MESSAVRFEIYQQGGEYWFRLVDRDDESLMFSGAHTCPEACLEVVAELKAIGRTSARYRIRTSPAGTQYFTVHGVLGDVLATSRLYPTRRERDAAEHHVREVVSDASVLLLRDTFAGSGPRRVAM